MTQAKSVYCLAALAILSLGVGVADANGPIQWATSEGGNDHYYEYIPYIGKATTLWEDAMLAAQALEHLGNEGYLASILSEEEGLWILDELFPTEAQRTPWSAWIGAFRDDTGSPWEWVSSEPWGSYEPWTPGVVPMEPGDAVYAAFTYRGLPDWWGSWNGVEPDEEYLVSGFIVEYVPEPATISLLAIGGLLGLRRRRHC